MDRTTAPTVAGLLAEPGRLRVFAAIALGATSVPEAARMSDVPASEAAAAVRRLAKGNLIQTDENGLRVRMDYLAQLARTAASSTSTEESGDASGGWLRTFVRHDRLISLPARLNRRREVLAHLTARTFAPGIRYDERAVNDKLRVWCAEAEVDHVTIRRYLVDLGVLTRVDGVYWLTDHAARPGDAAVG